MGRKQTILYHSVGEETFYVKGFHNFNYIFGNIYMEINLHVKCCELLYDHCKYSSNYRYTFSSINMEWYLHARKMHGSNLRSCLWDPVPSAQLASLPQGYSAQASSQLSWTEKDQGALLLATNVCVFSFQDISCYKNKLANPFLGLLLCGNKIAFLN